MNPVLSPAIDALGWSLVHFLWQGTAIALILGFALQTLGKRSAHLRYQVIGLAFVMMLGTFGVTLIYHFENSRPAVRYEAESTGPQIQRNEKKHPVEVTVSPVPEPQSPEGEPFPADSDSIETSAPSPAPTSIPQADARQIRIFVPSQRIGPMLPWIVAVWIAGVIFFSLRMLWGLRRVQGYRASGKEPADPAWNARFTALCEALHVSSAVRLLASATVPVPIVVGWLKPAILVPTSLFTLLTVPQLEAILAHELAHIRRHDYLVNLLQNVTETIFFFHPAVWWISAQLREEREHCCDDVASTQCGGVIEFARALTALEEICGTAPATSVAATGGSLLGRVRRLIGTAPPETVPIVSWPAGILVSLLVTSLATGAHFVNGRQGTGTTDSPRVRGLSLAGIPSLPNIVSIPEIHENPHFAMPVEVEESAPRLIYPIGKPHFYLEVQDRTYGPISGDPIEKLNLTEVLAGQLNSLDEKEATKRLFDLLSLGDDVLLATGYKIIPRLKDYDHNSIAYILREELNARPIAQTAAAGRIALQQVNNAFHAAIHDEAKDRWEKMKVEIPEDQYIGGRPIGAADSAIDWGEPNAAGLRLGVLGLNSEEPVPVGKSLNLKLFIRNDGEEEMKFNPTGRWGVGFNAVLTDEKGNQFPQRAALRRSLEPRVRLDPGHIHEFQFLPTQTIVQSKYGSPTTLITQPTAWVVRPDRYQVELSYHIGVFDVRSDWDEPNPGTVPGLGEWTGALVAKPMEIQFAPPEIKVAKPGETVRLSDRHQLRIEKGSISLTHRLHWPHVKRHEAEVLNKMTGEWENTPWGQVADVWKMKDPEGDFLAAWDVGGTRLWVLQGDRIQYLEFHHTFHDRGSWTMSQAVGGDLADMPQGVREALELPGEFAMRSPYRDRR